jgi:XTP/dITP diphosphohydrolase
MSEVHATASVRSGNSSRRLAVATANEGKLRELSALLVDREIAVIGQAELGIDSIPETGLTFVENALLKARHMAAQLRDRVSDSPSLVVLADDSGLVVPALGGAPGLYSARYSGSEASDADNNQLLLDNMVHLHGDQRRAWFHCTLVCLHHAADPDPLIAVARWHGHIAERCAGQHGFGYDPLFLPRGMSCTAADMAPTEKRVSSHRGQALRQLLAILPEWW